MSSVLASDEIEFPRIACCQPVPKGMSLSEIPSSTPPEWAGFDFFGFWTCERCGRRFLAQVPRPVYAA